MLDFSCQCHSAGRSYRSGKTGECVSPIYSSRVRIIHGRIRSGRNGTHSVGLGNSDAQTDVARGSQTCFASLHEADITTLGAFVSSLGIDLSLGSLIGLGIQFGVAAEAIEVAATMSFPKTPFQITSPLYHKPAEFNEITCESYIAKNHFDANLYSESFALMNALWDYQMASNKSSWCFQYQIAVTRMKQLFATRNSLRKRVAEFLGINEDKLQVILNVSGVYEVKAVECEDELNNFTTELSLGFQLSDTNVDALTELVETTYNALVNGYCDPLDRHDVRLELFGLSLSDRHLQDSDGCQLYQIRWNTLGQCRGCSEGTSLLDDEDPDLGGRLLV
jgi:hypothetical protein